MRVVREVYESYGFEPLETPAFENIETLLGKYGEEGNKLIFKILKRGEHEASGEADLALRYDLTVPLARVVAQYQHELPRFFKRYQIQPVWRADRPAKGRFREFYQCDIDAIGSTSPVVEAELLAAVSDVLGTAAIRDFRDPAESSARADGAARVSPESRRRCTRTRSSRSTSSTRSVPKASRRNCRPAGCAPDASAGLPQILRQRRAPDASPAEMLDRLREFVAGHEAGIAATRESARDPRTGRGDRARGRIRIDPSLARGLSYYTGAIMEIAVPDLAGSLGGGGRYDNLVGMFLGRDVPACGFSLGLERIIVVMTERNMFPAKVSPGAVDVMVTFLGGRPARRRGEARRRTARREAPRGDVSRSQPEARKTAQVRGGPQCAGPGDSRRGRTGARRSDGARSADPPAGKRARAQSARRSIAKRASG